MPNSGPAAALAGERRIVTVLFCDLKGSTALAESLDPEAWAELVDGAFRALRGPIERYEGTLARVMGDAVLAYFGAPIAHEDDPQRAILAAFEMRRELAGYQASLPVRSVDLAVRVGINTGLAVVGDFGLGKTRLLEEVRTEWERLGGGPWSETRAQSYGGATPYLLHRQSIFDACGVRSDDPPAVVRERVETAFTRLGQDARHLRAPQHHVVRPLDLGEELGLDLHRVRGCERSDERELLRRAALGRPQRDRAVDRRSGRRLPPAPHPSTARRLEVCHRHRALRGVGPDQQLRRLRLGLVEIRVPETAAGPEITHVGRGAGRRTSRSLRP